MRHDPSCGARARRCNRAKTEWLRNCNNARVSPTKTQRSCLSGRELLNQPFSVVEAGGAGYTEVTPGVEAPGPRLPLRSP